MKETKMQIIDPDEATYIYTDGLDYTKTGDGSVWGTEEKSTSELIEKSVAGGKWLNLCAGDGRFHIRLLKRVDKLVAADIDDTALEKLRRITPKEFLPKLETKKMNVTEPFPFGNETFDGIFCVGTLHLFPKEVFKKILAEIGRVLGKNGRIIIDMATDIKRTYPDGSLWIVGNEPNWKMAEAKVFLVDCFKDYDVCLSSEDIEPEDVTLNDKNYTFTCNFILVDAKKLKAQ